MSGWFRVAVVNAKNENVRTFTIEVPGHPHPIALGVGDDGVATPAAVNKAAKKLLEKGERIDQIVHLDVTTHEPFVPKTADEIQAQIARLQAQLATLE